MVYAVVADVLPVVDAGGVTVCLATAGTVADEDAAAEKAVAYIQTIVQTSRLRSLNT